MSSTSTPSDVQLPTVESGLTADELFGVLSDRRRRRVLGALGRQDGEMDRESLAETVGCDREHQRGEVEVTLYHLVLPELERADLVRHSDDVISLTGSGRSVASWLETVT